MELKATLKAPYAEEAKNQFIIKYNYNKGYDLKFYDTRIEAWGYTQKEIDDMEKERISNLSCTKRVLVLVLEEFGFDYYNDVEPKILQNRQAKLEWDLCNEVLRKNPLVNILGSELGLSNEQIDNIFKYANGEISSLGGDTDGE